jgi:hypothetical protein
MGFFSDLYDRAKSGVQSFVGGIGKGIQAVKKTYDNWSKGFYSAPGNYNYCGPNNPLENGEPTNRTDSICKNHDYAYEAIKNAGVKGEVLARQVRDADERMVNDLQALPKDERDVGSYLSEYGIRAKKQLENWGLLRPDQFVT